MKTVFIEFLIKNTIEPIGLALIEPEMPLSSLVIKFFGKIAYFLKKRKRKSTILRKTSEESKKNNKIIIPRTVLTRIHL